MTGAAVRPLLARIAAGDATRQAMASNWRKAVAPAVARRFLIDAHVHLHPCFDERVFFDSALANFRAADQARADRPNPVGCLLFTEAAREDVFSGLRRRDRDGVWQFRPTDEDCSLIACRERQPSLVVVAGRQIVSAERVEVLAFGTTAVLPDGQPLAQTLGAVRAAGALPALPWGFGKWLGRRGRLITEQIAEARPGDLFLGDNGGRPAWSPRPRRFGLAEARGLAVLPGSDPLPFTQEVRKVARYGFALQAPFDPATPFAPIRRALVALDASPEPFGHLERWHSFVHRQIAMQLRNRRRARR
jgi:hypothetical protein